MKKQVIVIHGGDTFDTHEEYIKFLEDFEFEWSYLTKKRWKNSLQERLGDGYEVIQPQMPCRWNAKYKEWKMWFEKLAPYFEDEVVLVGHSLGAIFLAKYLSEEKYQKKIVGTILVAAPYDERDADYSLSDFKLPPNLEKFQEQSEKIVFFQSRDDDVVPFADLEKYKGALPHAELCVFEDRGHFSQGEFPEIIEKIKELFE